MYEIFEKLLKEHNVTTYQVAKATGISTASFTGWKQGKWNFKQDKLQKIADYFDVSIEYLINGKDPVRTDSVKLNMYEVFEQLLQKNGVTPYKVAKATGVTQSTLSDWKNGRSTPKSENMKKLADYFGVSIDYLMTGKEGTDKEPQLTPKDEKDIKEILSSTEQLLKQDGLMFDGQPASPEAIDSILSAMQIGMEMAKKKNKEKYTPKKYKKD